MRILLAILCSTFLTLKAADADQANGLPPLSDVIDARHEHFDEVRFIGQFNVLCRTYGKEAFDKALTPFKDPALLNRATMHEGFTGQYNREIFFFLARIFWTGTCVEKDEAAAFAVLTDQAYWLGLERTTDAWKSRAEVRVFDDQLSRRYTVPEDIVGRSFTDWDIPPWTEREIPIGDRARSFRPAPLQAESLPGDTAPGAPDHSSYFGGNYAQFPPAQQVLGQAHRLAAQGFDAPVSVAYWLRQSKTLLTHQQHLALKWLETAAEFPFEHPYAFHFQALWHRDRVLAAMLAKEVGGWRPELSRFSRAPVDTETANTALSRALEVGDTSLLPLAYCLMDYQLWDQSGDSHLRRFGERYNNIFQGHDDARTERLTFQYMASLLLQDHGLDLPQEQVEKVASELPFLTRLWVRMTRDMSGLDLDPQLLPEDAIDLKACAARTGQTDFWQAMGLIEAPEKYWLGKDVAEAAFK